MSAVLTPHVQSTEQMSELVIELREFLGKLHDRAVRGRVAATQNEALPPLSPLAQELLKVNHVTLATPQPIHQLLTELEEIRITAPHMRVMLPAWPDASIRESITAQIRALIHPYMALTFTVRADMGGGCILQSSSHRYDFSFHAQLSANKHKISERLKAYATA